MDASERYRLVRELERIKKRGGQNRNKRRVFEIAVVQFLVSAEIMVLAIHWADRINTWFVFLLAFISLLILVSGIYGITSAAVDKRLQVIMEAILSEKEREGCA